MPNDKWQATGVINLWYQNRTDHQSWSAPVLWRFMVDSWKLSPGSTNALAKFLAENEAGFYVGTEGNGWYFRRIGGEMNLLVVVYRKNEGFAYGHILARGFSNAFCGDAIPGVLMEDLDNPRNPYVGKGTVSCEACIVEWQNGRRTGYRDAVANPDSVADIPSEETTPGNS